MPIIPWRILKTSHPRAHLVAGAMQSGQPTDDLDLNKAYAGVERLVKKLKPTGNYAMMIVRGDSNSGVHLAFELEVEAQRFGSAVHAEVAGIYAGWATQQSFLLSDITETAAPPSPIRSEAKQPRRNKLKRDIDLLGQMVQSNASTLKSKRLNDDDREALARQMATRMAHQKLLQQRLDRLST
jgi:hypothetical protein